MNNLTKVRQTHSKRIESIFRSVFRVITGIGIVFLIAIAMDFPEFGLFLTILRTLIVLSFMAIVYAVIEAVRLVTGDVISKYPEVAAKN